MGVESIELGGEFGVHDHPPLNTQNYCEKTYKSVKGDVENQTPIN